MIQINLGNGNAVRRSCRSVNDGSAEVLSPLSHELNQVSSKRINIAQEAKVTLSKERQRLWSK